MRPGPLVSAALLVVTLLAGCTATSEPSLRTTEQDATAGPQRSSSSDPRDQQFITDLRQRLNEDPQIANLMVTTMGEEQLAAIGRQDCDLIRVGKYQDAVALVGKDRPGSRVWKTVNTMDTLIPSALSVYCPELAPAFHTWATTPAGPQTPLSDTATLTVTSNKSRASTITYATWAGVQQANTQALPWSTTALVPHGDLTGVILTISAQADSGDTDTTITCTISVAGTVKATNTSIGGYSVVTCSL